jgi:hypothetical protein
VKRILFVTTLIGSVACASGPRRPAVVAIEPRCAALADTVSKYVSSDALPQARLAEGSRPLRAPASLSAGQTILVEFVVSPIGTADPATIAIVGSGDAGFRRDVQTFATTGRFVPGQLDGCPTLSRFTVTLAPGQ